MTYAISHTIHALIIRKFSTTRLPITTQLTAMSLLVFSNIYQAALWINELVTFYLRLSIVSVAMWISLGFRLLALWINVNLSNTDITGYIYIYIYIYIHTHTILERLRNSVSMFTWNPQIDNLCLHTFWHVYALLLLSRAASRADRRK